MSDFRKDSPISGSRRPPTFDDELNAVLDGGRFVPGDAGVAAVVNLGQVGDAQGAREVDVIDGDSQAGVDGLAVFVPGDRHGQVARGHHAGDEDALTYGGALGVRVLDQRRH